jgi:Zn-dependent protease with chaperone function
MTHYNEGEVKYIIQSVLAIFIAIVVTRFFATIGVNYSWWAGILAFVGLAVLYFSFRRNREFDLFVIILCIVAVPFVFMNYFLYVQ